MVYIGRIKNFELKCEKRGWLYWAIYRGTKSVGQQWHCVEGNGMPRHDPCKSVTLRGKREIGRKQTDLDGIGEGKFQKQTKQLS